MRSTTEPAITGRLHTYVECEIGAYYYYERQPVQIWKKKVTELNICIALPQAAPFDSYSDFFQLRASSPYTFDITPEVK